MERQKFCFVDNSALGGLFSIFLFFCAMIIGLSNSVVTPKMDSFTFIFPARPNKGKCASTRWVAAQPRRPASRFLLQSFNHSSQIGSYDCPPALYGDISDGLHFCAAQKITTSSPCPLRLGGRRRGQGGSGSSRRPASRCS